MQNMIEKNNELLSIARSLRREMTPQERRLWFCFLKNYPVKFFKQRIIENYIVDFYCSPAKLVIEVDGSQHYDPEKMESDRKRSEVFQKYGLEVIRFSNREVNQYFDSVCESIHRTVINRIGQNPYEVKQK